MKDLGPPLGFMVIYLNYCSISDPICNRNNRSKYKIYFSRMKG